MMCNYKGCKKKATNSFGFLKTRLFMPVATFEAWYCREHGIETYAEVFE